LKLFEINVPEKFAEAILIEVDRLRTLLMTFEKRRSEQWSYNSRLLEIQIKLPRSLRDRVLLEAALREAPPLFHMEFEKFLERRVPYAYTLEEKRIISNLEDRALNLDTNYLNGRVFGRIISLLRHLPVNLCEPRRPKMPQRARGYKDQGSTRLPHQDHGIPGKPPSIEGKLHREYLERQIDLLQAATHLLVRERAGTPVEENVELAETELTTQRNLRTDPFKALSDEELEKVTLAVQERKESTERKKPIQSEKPLTRSSIFKSKDNL